MFGHNAADKEAGHHLLGQEHVEHDDISHDMVWEQQNASTSGRETPNQSEIWDQDPLRDEGHELQQVSAPAVNHHTQQFRGGHAKRRARPEDHGEAATELAGEFERIFTPVSSIKSAARHTARR